MSYILWNDELKSSVMEVIKQTTGQWLPYWGSYSLSKVLKMALCPNRDESTVPRLDPHGIALLSGDVSLFGMLCKRICSMVNQKYLNPLIGSIFGPSLFPSTVWKKFVCWWFTPLIWSIFSWQNIPNTIYLTDENPSLLGRIPVPTVSPVAIGRRRSSFSGASFTVHFFALPSLIVPARVAVVDTRLHGLIH